MKRSLHHHVVDKRRAAAAAAPGTGTHTSLVRSKREVGEEALIELTFPCTVVQKINKFQVYATDNEYIYTEGRNAKSGMGGEKCKWHSSSSTIFIQ